MPTENDLFEEILAAFEGPPLYDPAVHLLASVCAVRWRMSAKNALTKLRQNAEAMGLEEIKVIGPSGVKVTAFRKKMPAG